VCETVAAESSVSVESTVKTTDKLQSADSGPPVSSVSVMTSSDSQTLTSLDSQQQQQQSIAGYYYWCFNIYQVITGVLIFIGIIA